MFLLSLVFAVSSKVEAKTDFNITTYIESHQLAHGKHLGKRAFHEKKVAGGIWVNGRVGDHVITAFYHKEKAHTVTIRPGKDAATIPEEKEWIEAGKWAVLCVESKEKFGNKALFHIQEAEAEKKPERKPAFKPEHKPAFKPDAKKPETKKPVAKKVPAAKNGGNADTVISIAAGEIGYSRWNDPETGTKYGRWYANLVGSSYYGESGVPFCAMFVSWVFDQAGATCAGLPGAYCPWIVDAGKNEGQTVSRSSAQKGDVVLFDWSGCSDGEADHVGIVESNDGSSTMTCIEGNTDNGAVARKYRDYGYILCVIRPYYDGSSGGSSSGGSSSGGSSSGGSSGGLDVDGYLGPASIRAWQAALGTSQDGVVSGQCSSDSQYLERLTSVSWECSGSSLVQAIQSKVGAGVDGYMGPNTVKSIQSFVGVDADGYLGPNTAKAIQQSLNDGKW